MVPLGLGPNASSCMTYGMDSCCAVEFRNSLEAKLGIELPGTLVFDYPTVAAIARHVSTLLAPAGAAASSAPTGSVDAAFMSSLLDSALIEAPGGYFDLAASGGSGTAVAVAALVTRQPAGIMSGGDPTWQVAGPASWPRRSCPASKLMHQDAANGELTPRVVLCCAVQP